MDEVKVRAIRTTVELREGDEAWVRRSERVDGLIAGGYVAIVEERRVKEAQRRPATAVEDAPAPRKSRRPEPEPVQEEPVEDVADADVPA